MGVDRRKRGWVKKIGAVWSESCCYFDLYPDLLRYMVVEVVLVVVV